MKFNGIAEDKLLVYLIIVLFMRVGGDVMAITGELLI